MIHVLERRGEIGLEFSGFLDEQRARRNRKVAAQRALGARDPEREQAERQRELEMWWNRLKRVEQRAAALGIDLSPHEAIIRAAIVQIEGMVAEHGTIENLKARGR